MTRLTIAACIAALAATAGMAVAQDYANIVVGGDIVARIRTGGEHGSMHARAREIDQRVTDALANERHNIFVQETGLPDLYVAQVNGLWTLSIGDQVLMRAFPEDAAGAGTTTKAIAYQWKENFSRQLPRAVSPIHVPGWWVDPHAEEEAISGQKPHNMPDEDLVLTREVAAILQEARDMPEESFEALLPAMERTMLQRIWTYRHPACGAPPLTEHIRARSALKRARGLDEAKYRYEKYWLAGLTINKLRDAMDMPAGVGPVPEQRDLLDFEAPTPPSDTGGVASGATPADPATIAQPDLAAGTPIERVAIGTGLARDNSLLNMGQQFDASTAQLLVYLQIGDARPNTIVGVSLEKDGGIVARRLVRVSGDRRMAVTFYPARATTFETGDYRLKLSLNGEDAGVVPFRIGAR